MSIEELEPGQEGDALDFLERDPVRNLRMIWALRRWGLFDLGLAWQGRYLAACGPQGITGLLFLDNQGMMRSAARGEAARALAERAVSIWGIPEVLAGPEDEVEQLLSAAGELAQAVVHREEEVSLILTARDFTPRGGMAAAAGEEDLEGLVELERLLQVELLGGSAEGRVLRSQLRRSLEEASAALVRCGGRVVAKAEIEASTPLADELGGVYTLPEFRRRGFAAAACSMVCGMSLVGGKAVRLETQRGNGAAAALYARLGFRELWHHLSVRFGGGGGAGD